MQAQRMIGSNAIWFLRPGRDVWRDYFGAIPLPRTFYHAYLLSECAHISRACSCFGIGSQRLSIGASKKPSKCATKQKNNLGANKLANQNSEMCILDRQGHSLVKCQLVCLASLLISIWLCGQHHREGFLPRSIHKKYGSPPRAPLLRIPNMWALAETHET